MANAIASEQRLSSNICRTLLFIFGGVALLIHLLTNGRYGYFRDELYYMACGQRLAFGYVDQPPLSIFLLRLSRILFGDSLFAIRLLPALASMGTIVLTGMIARELGGRSWAIILSCAASLIATIFLILGNFFSMNAFEPLFWMGCISFLVRIINGGRSTLWIWFGLVAGLGIENKHSAVFFGVAVVIALSLTPERRHFGQRWIWLGGLVAFLVVLPNLIWQVQNHWPTWELLNNVARSRKNIVLNPIDFLAQQVLIMNPGTLPLWIGGLIWLFAAPDGRRYRALGIIYLVLLVEFILLRGKIYYLAPAYPMLFAAGGVAAERLFKARWWWLKPALLAIAIIPSGLLAPVALPILSPERLIAYMESIHFHPPRTETSHTAPLPQYFADQFGWEEMVSSVGHVYHHLRPQDEKRAAIFCQNYGEAAAIDFFGPKYKLPSSISGHQNYFLWGPRQYSGEVMLVLDIDADDEREQFAYVEDLGQVVSSPWAMPFERRTHIYLCRDLKGGNLQTFWPRVKKWL